MMLEPGALRAKGSPVVSFERAGLPARVAVSAATAIATAAAAITTAAATTATATATTAAEAATATTAAAATAAIFTRLGLVDVQVTTVKLFAIELLDGFLALFVGSHFDEAEAARAARLTIFYDGSGLDSSGL
ncbi:MAG: hypothetical protein QOD00_3729 [Blastocatellia bacterium]|nr:hypothetical protein [Blastocatellia bacterium]